MQTLETRQTKPLSSFKEAAKALGCSYDTLRRRINNGWCRKLRYSNPGPGARVQILTESIDECLKDWTKASPE